MLKEMKGISIEWVPSRISLLSLRREWKIRRRSNTSTAEVTCALKSDPSLSTLSLSATSSTCIRRTKKKEGEFRLSARKVRENQGGPSSGSSNTRACVLCGSRWPDNSHQSDVHSLLYKAYVPLLDAGGERLLVNYSNAKESI
jgi:hypothetical protein